MFFYFDFLCLWAMVSIRRLLQVSLPPPCPLPGFRQVCLLFYKKCLINLLLLWSGYFRKIMHFWRKQDFFFKLIAGRFWVCCCVYVFTASFYSSAIMKLRIKSCYCFFGFRGKQVRGWCYLHNCKLPISFRGCKERII